MKSSSLRDSLLLQAYPCHDVRDSTVSHLHYNDIIMTTMSSQITILTVVYSTVYSDAGKKNTSKLRVTGLCAVNSPHKGPVTRKCFHLMTSSCLAQTRMCAQQKVAQSVKQMTPSFLQWKFVMHQTIAMHYEVHLRNRAIDEPLFIRHITIRISNPTVVY